MRWLSFLNSDVHHAFKPLFVQQQIGHRHLRGAMPACVLNTGTVAMAGEAAPGARLARAVSDDGALAVALRAPTGRDAAASGGTDAEQLFAAGLATGFRDALAAAARARGIALVGTINIVASVQLQRLASKGDLFLSASLEVSLPSLDVGLARALMHEARRRCPYAGMARSGMHSTFTLR